MSSALRGDAAATWARRPLGRIHPGNRRFACRIPPGFGLAFFFVAAFGCVERVRMEKGGAGLAEAFGYWEHVSHPSPLRSTDAQTQPRSCRSLVLQPIGTSQAARIWVLGNICFALQS